MNYCKQCSIQILGPWQGWPLIDPVPLLPQFNNGFCVACGQAGDAIANTEIQWLNYHGPHNTGLPDYWLLVTDQTTVWGAPYYSEEKCPRCRSRSVVSEHGDSRRDRFNYKLICPSCHEQKLHRLQEEKLKKTIIQQEKEAKDRRKRHDYYRAVAAMPFEKRVLAIAKNQDPEFIINSREEFFIDLRERMSWIPEWNRSSAEEIAALSVESLDHIIDLCEHGYFPWSRDLRQELYDRRHQVRQDAMESIRQEYKGMSAEQQLTKLVVLTSIPIAHYPVELAEFVSPDWLASLPAMQRDNFIRKITACKLRIWVRARKKLSLEGKQSHGSTYVPKHRGTRGPVSACDPKKVLKGWKKP